MHSVQQEHSTCWQSAMRVSNRPPCVLDLMLSQTSGGIVPVKLLFDRVNTAVKMCIDERAVV